jgi:succinate dehydrogenase/fumarate reductase flavoprotein subunit
VQNMLTVGALITAGARARSCSVGTHTRLDSSGSVDYHHHAFTRPKQEP